MPVQKHGDMSKTQSEGWTSGMYNVWHHSYVLKLSLTIVVIINNYKEHKSGNFIRKNLNSCYLQF